MLNQILALVELVQGVLFGSLAYVTFQKKKAKMMLCYKTEGEVIDVKEKPGSEASTYHPVVKYRTATGEEITFEGPYGSSNWKVKPGDRLPLLVNRTNPNDAEVETFMAQWGLTLVFVVISVVGFIAAPIMFLLLRA